MFELSGISKSYQQTIALNNVSMELQSGEIYGLLGPNGAGKSTLIRIINQILTADSGWMKFQNDLFRQEHLKQVGYLPEERGLYRSMTVEDHGVFLGRLRGLKKKETQILLNMWLEKFGIQEWRKKRIEELSKGMAQKVQFIFSVLHQPKLIILDEPFSGFDPLNIELIKREIVDLKNEGRCILISTHNMNSVEEICERGMLLNKGKTVLEGNIKSMRDSQKTGIFSVQFEGNMIAFVNALWAGFEIINQRDLLNNRFEVELKMKRGNTIDELMSVLIGHVKIERIEEMMPSMQEVFVNAIDQSNQVTH